MAQQSHAQQPQCRNICVLGQPPPDITDFTTNPIQFVTKACILICKSFWLMFTSFSPLQILFASLQLVAAFSLIATGILFFIIFWPLYIFVRIPVSFVNASEPQLLKEYKPPLSSLSDEKPDVKQRALFFVQLSSVVYERNKRHNQILNRWWNQEEFPYFEVRRVVYPTSCNATVIGYIAMDPDPRKSTDILNKKKKGKFVFIIAFKGTNPFDQSEWLTDFTLSRCPIAKYDTELQNHNISFASVTGPDSVPEVHEGFYDSFFKDPENGLPDCAFDGILKACKEVRTVLRTAMLNDGIEETGCKVFLTGHSLGAALCSVFTIFLMGYQDENGNDDDLGFLKKNLKGIYTYGNPNVCNHALATYANQQLEAGGIRFRSVRNGNDIVGIMPLGELYGGDYYKLGTEYRVDYHGNIAKCCYDRNDWWRVNHWWSAKITLFNMLWSWPRCCAVGVDAVRGRFRHRKDDDDAIKEIIDYPSVWTALMTAFSSTLLEDHTPSEYVQNLYKVSRSKFIKCVNCN